MLSRSLGTITKRAASSASRVSSESITKLDNGLTVASIEQNGAASQLLVAFRAGSRFETPDSQGTVHLLRNAIGTDSDKHYGPMLVWNAAQQGSSISASSTRDIFAVQMKVVRDNSALSIGLIGELANPRAEPWNVEEATEALPADQLYMCPATAVLEGIHEAAFRNGPLGKSAFIINNVPSWKKVQQFKNEYFRFGNAVIVGVNVDHNQLVEGASAFRFAEGSPAAGAPSKYFGGEIRVQHSGPSTFVSLAGEGSALSDFPAVAAQAVAAELLQSTLAKSSASVSALNVSYSDSGLLGVSFNAPHAIIGQLTKTVASTMKNLKADDKSVQIAKAKTSLQVLSAAEQSSSVALDQAIQLLSHGSTISPSEFAELISKVSSSDVNKALSKATAKLSISAYGNVASVPYLDEL